MKFVASIAKEVDFAANSVLVARWIVSSVVRAMRWIT